MSESILPGGCLPPQFPPPKFPPVEPELDGSDLSIAVDWMTYSHDELYPMATEGLDLAGANTVAAKWADIAEQLRGIGADLDAAITKSQHGWEGDSAELARRTAAKLSVWSEDTSHRADEAGGCVSRQADIAQRASNAMPEPVATPEPPMLCGTPDVNQPKGPLSPAGGTSAMSASSPFTGGGFEQAGLLAEQPWEPQEKARAAHRQAAEVMQRMQRESAEVYGTVPWFVPPRAGEDPYRRGPHEDDEHRRRSDDPATDTSTRSAGAGAAAGGPGALGAGGGGGAAGGALGAPDTAGRSQLSPGGQYGVGGPAAGGGAAAASAGAGGVPRGMGGMGAMPMGGMGGGGSRGEEEERKGASYLAGEKGLFDPDESPYEKLLGGDDPEEDKRPRRRRMRDA